MKKIIWIFGIILLFVGLSACDKNDFETNPGLDDMDLKGAALELDEAGSAFAYGTHVFTSNPKANPDGLVPLSLTKNRWGWANKQMVNGITPYNPPVTMYDLILYPASNPSQQTIITNGIQFWNDALNLYVKLNYPIGEPLIPIGLGGGILMIQTETGGHQTQHGISFYSTVNTVTIPLDKIRDFFGCDYNLILFIEGLELLGAQPRIKCDLEYLRYDNSVPRSIYTVSCHPSVTNFYINNVNDNYGNIEVFNDNENFYMSFYITKGVTEQNWQQFSLKTPSFELAMSSIPSGENNFVKTFTHDLRTGPGYLLRYTVSFPLSELNQIPDYTAGSPVYLQLVNTDLYDYNTGNAIPVKFSTSIDEEQSGFHQYNLYSPNAKPSEYPIYMGAGLNDTTKGTQVGIATVTYKGSELKIKYDLFDEYTMNEVHIYASDLQPTTIAPGQYGFMEIFNEPVNEFETILNIEDAEDDGIWLILHAVIAL